MSNNKHPKSLDTTTFLRIRKWYLLAFAGIALTVIIAQILIQFHLNSQLDDSRVINIAGRQRAFSQKLVKETLLLGETSNPKERKKIISELDKTLSIWKASHKGLQQGDANLNLPKENDEDIIHLFKELDTIHTTMVDAVDNILKNLTNDNSISKIDIAILLKNERPFLELMDTIVNEYDKRSKEQLQNLKQKEYLILAISLIILILEMLFIFKPLSIQIRKTITKLIRSQRKSETDAKEIKALFIEKENRIRKFKKR